MAWPVCSPDTNSGLKKPGMIEAGFGNGKTAIMGATRLLKGKNEPKNNPNLTGD
jgi:hypothetical protein